MKSQEMKWLLFILFEMAVLQVWSQNVHVYNTATNVMWKGITNRMGMSVDGELKMIMVNAGKVEYSPELWQALYDSLGNMNEWKYMQDSGFVLIIPDCDAQVVEVTLEYILPSGEFKSETRNFRPIQLETPKVVFQGKTKKDNVVSKSLLMSGLYSSIQLMVDPSSLLEGISYECIAFEVDINHEGKTKTFSCHGNQFSGAALKALETLSVGDFFVLRDVQILTPCGVKSLDDRLELLIN